MVDRVRPVVDDDGARHHLGRQQDGVCVDAVPTLRKRQRRVEKVLGVADHAARQRHQRAHLGHGTDDGADEHAHDGVREEQAERAPVGEGLARREEQARADGARERNHLDVALLEAALGVRQLGEGGGDLGVGRRFGAIDVAAVFIMMGTVGRGRRRGDGDDFLFVDGRLLLLLLLLGPEACHRESFVSNEISPAKCANVEREIW
ncbi:hypothetical protein PWT90_11049 [Aphanocladium album]|nr:hypothetical protein PWT90_11049 [Aphanocladium album]